MMRRIYHGSSGKIGPLFWVYDPPPGFAAASQINDVKRLSEVDGKTQADVALLLGEAAAPTGFTPPCRSDGGTSQGP